VGRVGREVPRRGIYEKKKDSDLWSPPERKGGKGAPLKGKKRSLNPGWRKRGLGKTKVSPGKKKTTGERPSPLNEEEKASPSEEDPPRGKKKKTQGRTPMFERRGFW